MWCRNKLGRLAGGLFAAGKAPPDCKLAPASAGAFLRFWRPFGGSLARVYWALAGLIWRLKVTHPLIHKGMHSPFTPATPENSAYISKVFGAVGHFATKWVTFSA